MAQTLPRAVLLRAAADVWVSNRGQMDELEQKTVQDGAASSVMEFTPARRKKNLLNCQVTVTRSEPGMGMRGRGGVAPTYMREIGTNPLQNERGEVKYR